MSTILLPRWSELLEAEGILHRIIPRDVATRWNSTIDMCAAMVELEGLVKSFMAARGNDLRNLELTEDEWEIIKQLVKVLQVRISSCSLGFPTHRLSLSTMTSGAERRDLVLL